MVSPLPFPLFLIALEVVLQSCSFSDVVWVFLQESLIWAVPCYIYPVRLECKSSLFSTALGKGGVLANHIEIS